MTDIAKRVTETILEKLEVEPEKVIPEASFADDLGSDPLDTDEVIEALAKEFDISIPGEDAEKLTTVGKLIEYIKKHANA